MKKGDRVECIAREKGEEAQIGWTGTVCDVEGQLVDVTWDNDGKDWLIHKRKLKLITDNWKPFDVDNPPSVYARIELEYSYNGKNWAFSTFKWPRDAESVRMRVVRGDGYRYREIEPDPVKRTLDDIALQHFRVGFLKSRREKSIPQGELIAIAQAAYKVGFRAGRDPQYDDVEVD